MTLQSEPAFYLGFASLHVLLGHIGSAIIFRLRFGHTPLVLYQRATSAHQRRTKLVSAAALMWGIALVVTALQWSMAGNHILDRLLMPIGDRLYWLDRVGWTIATLGYIIMLVSQFAMGSAFRVGQAESAAPEALFTGGAHRWSRNPIYVGSWLAIAGMTLWHPSVLLLASSVVLAIGIHSLVVAEETFLRTKFGEQYRSYAARTPRYIGIPR